MSLLFQATLPIPPSVNNRTLITRYGGREHPSVTAYKWLCKEPLRTAYRDERAILNARRSHAWLAVHMQFFLTVQITRGRIQFEIRDLDNMAQVPLNILKVELGIDDARIVDLPLSKRPLEPGAAATLLIRVEDLEDFNAIQDPRTTKRRQSRDYCTHGG